MKKFLKKANRGLILGAFALISLIIYIVVDYSSFSNEKIRIKEAVENYIGGFYDTLELDDYKALEMFVKDSWASEPVMNLGYYEDKESMLTLFESIESEKPTSEYGEITFSMDEMTIKKCGPNMALVTIKYSAEIEYGCNADIIEPLYPYISYWYYSEEKDDKRYIYDMDFEGSIYLRKEDGEWKIAQSDVWSYNCNQREKEGE